MAANSLRGPRVLGVLVAFAAAWGGGCSWVTLKPSAGDVVVAYDEHVQNCRRLGQTTVRTTDSVAGVSRGADAVSEELERLARNAAVDAGADTIVPAAKPWWGEQRFNMYRCRQ